ncbi:MAG: CDP-alcohol phosphatidyltransferase family protein [Puniceicoccales bacterium]|nr:CDP-alcohol phosphatidyltransferase family protein [Puniceicoccales bacterium]
MTNSATAAPNRDRRRRVPPPVTATTDKNSPPNQNRAMFSQLPNIITLSRVPLLFVIAGLVAWDAPWCASAALAVFMLAAGTDFLDGWLARRLRLVSNFGKLMDALTDKILLVGLMIFLLVYPTPFSAAGRFAERANAAAAGFADLFATPDAAAGAAAGVAPAALAAEPPMLPAWCVFPVVIILVRELLVTGLRLVAASSNRVLSAERSGKIKTVLQILALMLLLTVHAANRDWTSMVFIPADYIEKARAAALGAFWLAALLTVTSGVGYLVKYWDIFMGNVPQPPAPPPENGAEKS